MGQYFYLKLVFRGICFGFAGGSRQRILFEFYGMPLEKIFTLPMTVDVEKLQREFQKLSSKDEIKRELGLNARINIYLLIQVAQHFQEVIFILMQMFAQQ